MWLIAEEPLISLLFHINISNANKCPRVQQGRAPPLDAQGSGSTQHRAAGLRGSVPGAGGSLVPLVVVPAEPGLT